MVAGQVGLAMICTNKLATTLSETILVASARGLRHWCVLEQQDRRPRKRLFEDDRVNAIHWLSKRTRRYCCPMRYLRSNRIMQSRCRDVARLASASSASQTNLPEASNMRASVNDPPIAAYVPALHVSIELWTCQRVGDVGAAEKIAGEESRRRPPGSNCQSSQIARVHSMQFPYKCVGWMRMFVVRLTVYTLRS